MHTSQHYDPTYYGLSLLAHKTQTPKIWALLALKAELASIAHKVTDPQMGYVRLAWWRDALQNLPNTANQHPILATLAAFSTPQLNTMLAAMATHTAESLVQPPDWAALQLWADNEIWPLWQAWGLLCGQNLTDFYKPYAQCVALTRNLRQNLVGKTWLPQTLLLNASDGEALVNYAKLLDAEWQKISAAPTTVPTFMHDIWVQHTWFKNFKAGGYKANSHTLNNPKLWLWRCWWHNR